MPEPPQLGPLGGASVPVPNLSTEDPGLGNCRSMESAVEQSVAGMLALNRSGKLGVARSESSGMP